MTQWGPLLAKGPESAAMAGLCTVIAPLRQATRIARPSPQRRKPLAILQGFKL
jgi:hypothetical protein